jgi:hypothetical protein
VRRIWRVGRAIAPAAGGYHPRPGSHIQHQIRDFALGEGLHQLLDARQGVLPQPFDDIPVRRQQPQLSIVLNGLQGTHPGIELLHREFALEHAQTAIP